MQTTDFTFDLPEELIAQRPPPERGMSRLLVLDRNTRTWQHSSMTELPRFLPPGALLVFNDSRVRKARLRGTSADGSGCADFLLIEKKDDTLWKALVPRARKRKPGSVYQFDQGLSAEVRGNAGRYIILHFNKPVTEAYIEECGHIPLPPYIKRADEAADSERYQTVYARDPGSVAAPTAGLHFSSEMLAELAERGFESAFVSLDVGPGTFFPVRAETIEAHVMHAERYRVGAGAAERIEQAKQQGRAIAAVGTTSMRVIESAWEQGRLRRGEGRTSLFIYPGYTFKAVDLLFTNFHTPRSTLLMLVSAFAGRDFILEAYREAVRERYRFFSYGDAMLIR
ncbi:MAG: tRNA preQ1(34) S-adenosylmethionine ribosyltransferase-isomerase QueA [Treponema sp.]|jgi:S-adenosylmethionine:tRNA ribosyltransferase-isomerase|nr:tRNA preQ1(34) S-adenosylmethionine ribosyltransferase-isomerase QueA [Treponema sp.]